jgi:hypothetical protein
MAYALGWALLVVVVAGALSVRGVVPGYVIGLALLPLVPWRRPNLHRKQMVLGGVLLLLALSVATLFLGPQLYALDPRPPVDVSVQIEGEYDEVAGIWTLREDLTLAKDEFVNDLPFQQLVTGDLKGSGWSPLPESQQSIVMSRARTFQFAAPDLLPTSFVLPLNLGTDLGRKLRPDKESQAYLRLPAGLALSTLPSAQTRVPLPGNIEQVKIALNGLRGDDSVSVEMGGWIGRNPILALVVLGVQGLGGQLLTGLVTLVVAMLKDRIWQAARGALTRLRGSRRPAGRAKASKL